MTAAAAAADFALRIAQARDRPAPAPLAWPAVAFLAGIAAPEVWPRLATTVAWTLACAGVLLAVAACAAPAVRHARVAMLSLVVGAGFVGGYLRRSLAVVPAEDSVARITRETPELTRILARVVSPPVAPPAVQRNPFLPYIPPPRTRFVAEALELRNSQRSEPLSGRLRVYVDAASLAVQPGQRVLLTGWLARVRGSRNPGEVDWARVARLDGIEAVMNVESPANVAPIGEAGGWDWALSRARAAAHALLLDPWAAHADRETQSLLEAMVLGQRSAVGPELNDIFRRTGTIHVLSVSGFHVGVLLAFVWLMSSFVARRGRRTTAAISGVVVLLYALLAEPNAPVWRSAVMGVVGCATVLVGRPLCLLNWLALSAICVLLFNPLDLLRPGFQLSFVQVLALILVVPSVYRALTRPQDIEAGRRADPALPRWVLVIAARWCVGLALVSVVAWVVAAPLTLLHFGQIAPWGALQSFILTVPVSLVVVLGFVTIGVQMIPGLGAIVGALLGSATAALIAGVAWLAQLPGSQLEVQPPPVWLVWLSYGCMGWVGWKLQRVLASRERAAEEARIRTTTPHPTPGPAERVEPLWPALIPLLLAVAIWSGWALWPPRDAHVPRLCVLSVGHGSATIVASNGRAAVVDAGTNANRDVGDTVARALHTMGLRELDWLAISHDNLDHFSGAPTLLQRVRVAELITTPYLEPARADGLPRGRLLPRLGRRACDLRRIEQGDELTLGRARLEVLWPPHDLAGGSSANNTSLVLRCRIAGRSVLLPGDIEGPAIEGLLDAHRRQRVDLRADVLIAPHHGSVVEPATSAFYDAVRPAVVVISVARDRPNLRALVQRVLGPDCRVVSTHALGAVIIRFAADGGMRVETPFAAAGDDDHEQAASVDD